MAETTTKKKTTKKASTKKATAKKAGSLKLKLVKSVIGSNERQRQTVNGLGLRRLHQTVVRPDTPEIRGMVTKVQHLLEVTEG